MDIYIKEKGNMYNPHTHCGGRKRHFCRYHLAKTDYSLTTVTICYHIINFGQIMLAFWFMNSVLFISPSMIQDPQVCSFESTQRTGN